MACCDRVFKSLAFTLRSCAHRLVAPACPGTGQSTQDQENFSPTSKASDKRVLVLFEGLEEFRQHLGGRLTLTMIPEVGQPMEVHEVNRPLMLQAIDRVREFAQAHGVER